MLLVVVVGNGKAIRLKSFQSGIFIVKHFNFQQYSEIWPERDPAFLPASTLPGAKCSGPSDRDPYG